MSNVKNYEFLSLKNDELFIIHVPDGDDRKKMHSFLEHNYPLCYKTSHKSRVLKGQIKAYVIKCCCGGKKYIKSSDFWCCGCRDEHYVEDCYNCSINDNDSINIHYKDDCKLIYHNNIIVIGDFIKEYKNTLNQSNVSDSEFDYIYNNADKFTINIPSNKMKKHKLSKYFDDEITKIKSDVL
jgi:hypothetical protein